MTATGRSSRAPPGQRHPGRRALQYYPRPIGQHAHRLWKIYVILDKIKDITPLCSTLERLVLFSEGLWLSRKMRQSASALRTSSRVQTRRPRQRCPPRFLWRFWLIGLFFGTGPPIPVEREWFTEPARLNIVVQALLAAHRALRMLLLVQPTAHRFSVKNSRFLRQLPDPCNSA